MKSKLLVTMICLIGCSLMGQSTVPSGGGGGGGGSGEVNLLGSLGAGTSIAGAKSGVTLNTKSIIAGSNITITNNANQIGISAAGGGGGDTVWTNNAGVIQPVSTNQFAVHPSGGVGVGYRSDTGINDSFFRGISSIAQGGSVSGGNILLQGYDDYSSPTNENSVSLAVGGLNGNPFSKLTMNATHDDYNTEYLHGEFTVGYNGLKIILGTDSRDLLALLPDVADGTTPYTFDTSVLHTTGNLMEVKNAGTNQFRVSPWGGVGVGSRITPIQGDLGSSDAFISVQDLSVGDPGQNTLTLLTVSDIDYTANSQLQAETGIFGADQYGFLNMDSFSATNYVQSRLVVGSGSLLDAIFKFMVSGATMTRLQPTIADGSTPYLEDTTIFHTSGNLVEVNNLSTNKFTVSHDGALTTGDPGSGIAAWKFGRVVTGVSVALVITNYIEIEIGGVVKKLALVQ